MSRVSAVDGTGRVGCIKRALDLKQQKSKGGGEHYLCNRGRIDKMLLENGSENKMLKQCLEQHRRGLFGSGRLSLIAPKSIPLKKLTTGK